MKEYPDGLGLHGENAASKKLNEIRGTAAWFSLGRITRLAEVKDPFLHRDYPDIFIAMIDYLEAGNPQVKSLQELFKALKDKDEAYRKSQQIANQALESLPFQGLSVLEIGGSFGQALHALGAEAWCIDPDIEGENEWREEDMKYNPRERREFYHPVAQRLNTQNWRQFLEPEQFDVTFSRMVLCHNSGTSSDWRRKVRQAHPIEKDYGVHMDAYCAAVAENKAAEEKARQELFVLSGHATKAGGFVIHQSDAIEELLPLCEEAGLVLMEKRQTYIPDVPSLPTYIFRKQG